MNIRLKISDCGEDAICHWIIVQLLDHVTGVIYDEDKFRWAKATKFVLTNSPPDPLNPPDGWIPIFTGPREANKFDYNEMINLAARHFLRRQGLIVRKPGLAWNPSSFTKISGLDVVKTEFNSDKLAKMQGALFNVQAPDVIGQLTELHLPMGTVTTISADFDGTLVESPLTCTDGGTTLNIGINGIGFYLRTYARFPLASIDASDSITNVQLIINVLSINGGGSEADIQAYNQDGQADVEADTCANKDTRTANDATPYLDNITDFTTTGIKTLDLGTDADSDVEAAKDAVDRFSLAINENANVTTGDNSTFEAIEDAGTDEPKLEVTHTAVIAQVSPSDAMTSLSQPTISRRVSILSI